MAMILGADEPEQCLQLLRKAIELEPNNPETYLAMANFIERQGLSAEARNFYVTANIKSRNNPFFSDQLAEFYIRQSKYTHAISTWQSIPEESRGPMQLFKMMAWSKLTELGKVFNPEEHAISMMRYSADWAPAFSFLSGQADVNLDYLNNDNALFGHPLILWSHMLQLLSQDNYQAAHTDLLDKYGAYSSVHPELALAILMVLEIRSGSFSPIVMNYVRLYKKKSDIELNIVIRHLIQDYESIQDENTVGTAGNTKKCEFWAAGNIFPLIFSSVGWSGAADEWYKDSGVRNEIRELPAWAVYAHIKSLLRARSYGSKYKLIELFPSPVTDTALKLLRAEVYLANRDYIPALKGLAEISQRSDDFGVRAGWLAGMLYLENGRLDDVEKLISNSPHFSMSTRGREILAKLELARLKPSSALEIYRLIQDDSPEAQAFLFNYYNKTGDSIQAQKLLRKIQSSNINEPALWNLVTK